MVFEPSRKVLILRKYFACSLERNGWHCNCTRVVLKCLQQSYRETLSALAKEEEQHIQVVERILSILDSR